ncbi:MAG: CocE/NonD family hydrolase [Chloroflexota bacterium]
MADRAPRRYVADGQARGYPVRTEHVRIPMDDGIDLAATLYLPDAPGDGSFPAVLESIPYRKDDWTLSRDWSLHGAFAAAGYASCRLDVRGTGSSRGIADDEYTEREILDNLAVIDWLANRPGAAGPVGMFGISWGGFSALQAAMRRPPALKAIIPACFSHDRYHVDVHWWGGTRLIGESVYWPVEMVGENALPPDPQRFGPGWREEWLRRLEATPQWPLASLRHQRRDAHWRHGSAIEDWESIEAAVLALGGLNDWYRDSVLAVVANVRAPRRGILGPWGHAWPHAGSPGQTIDGVGLMTRWWDRWLKDERNGIDDGPALSVFVVEPEADRPFPAEVAPAALPGRWWSIGRWPSDPPIAPPAPLHLAGAGAAGHGSLRLGRPAADDAPDTWSGGPAAAMAAPFTCTGSEPQGGPLDQRPDDARSLVYTGDPLAEPILVAGTPAVDLWLAADRPVAQVAVRLEALAPGGTSALLARGLLNLTRRHSFAEPAPVRPGEVMAVTIPLTATGARVPAGQRLRVAVAGAAFPVAWPPPAPVVLTVFHDAARPSRLRLPTPAGWAPATEDLGTGASDPGTAEERPGIPEAWRVERDELAGTTTLVSEAGGANRFPERGGLLFGSEERYRIVAGDDWATCVAEGRAFYRLVYPEGRLITADGSLVVRSTAADFDVRIDLSVAEDGAPVFEQTWKERIPRDLL